MSRQAADKALRQTCEALGMQGVSTHSFRRSFATSALRRGVDLPTIQRVTGHKSLGSLGHYLEVGEAEVLVAELGAHPVVRVRREMLLKDGDILSFGEVQYWFLHTDTLHQKLKLAPSRGFGV
jgi:integrase/recombinase XerD